MLLKEQWIREGFSSYYVVEKHEELTYEKDILLCHTMDCLLPCEFRLQDDAEYYYFETGIYTPFLEVINQLEPKEFFYEFILAMEEMEEFLLILDHLQISEKLLFLREQKYPVFCYLPEYEKNIFEQIREFLELCMEHISYEDKKKVKFYYEFHSFIVKEKPNLEQIKVYLKPEEEEPKEEPYVLEEVEEAFPETQEMIQKSNDVKIIGYSLSSFLFLGAIAYFTVKIYRYGLVYQFVCGEVAAIILFGVIVAALWKEWKHPKHQTWIPEEEEGTQLLQEDDEKTMLLLNQPLGKLVPIGKEGEDIWITENKFVIGSSANGTDYQLLSAGVSRRHMEFTVKDEKVYLKDLESTNGTRVNGEKIENCQLFHGDIIKIGLEEFKFVL